MANDDVTGRLAAVRSRRVMIATPVYRDTSWQYTRALVDTCLTLERMGVHHCCQFVIGNSNLPRARNELAATFLASDCTDLIFIDADMGWKPNDVLRLLASDKDVIGGCGRKRSAKPNSDPAVWCAWLLPDANVQLHQDDMGAIEVAGVGTGFLRISRAALTQLALLHPEWKLAGRGDMPDGQRDMYHSFFQFGSGEDEIGEDYLFCRRWREAGGTVWIDAEINLLHVGAQEYSGSIAELFVPNEMSEAA
jgi:hypothetical protein